MLIASSLGMTMKKAKAAELRAFFQLALQEQRGREALRYQEQRQLAVTTSDKWRVTSRQEQKPLATLRAAPRNLPKRLHSAFGGPGRSASAKAGAGRKGKRLFIDQRQRHSRNENCGVQPCYSYLRATMGSTFIARRAGM
jgi:hypothetical protein